MNADRKHDRSRKHICVSLLVAAWSLHGCGDSSPPKPANPEGRNENPNGPTQGNGGSASAGQDAAPNQPAADGGNPGPVANPDAGNSGPGLDEDGVVMLFPANTAGSSWRLGTRDPNTIDDEHFDMGGDRATAGNERGIKFWTTHGHKVTYASGMPDGVTVRLNIRAGGGEQHYTWKNGAIDHGFIGTDKDLKNFELTAYVRVRDSNRTHQAMAWKMRGGNHTGSHNPSASCTGLSLPEGASIKPDFVREFDHPDYDFVSVDQKFPFYVQADKWIAFKAVSYLLDDKSTQNTAYIDDDPFDAAGKPKNNFRVYMEKIDKTGESSGKYKIAATWAGWVTTMRIDGWKSVDFSILSAREIVPPR